MNQWWPLMIRKTTVARRLVNCERIATWSSEAGSITSAMASPI
jgi:hypothetical protein